MIAISNGGVSVWWIAVPRRWPPSGGVSGSPLVGFETAARGTWTHCGSLVDRKPAFDVDLMLTRIPGHLITRETV
jgi:hypothetical protein